MSDLFNLSDLGVADVAGNGPGAGTDLLTGDLRRKYAFGSGVSELAIAQDPFFRFVSLVSKSPTDDPAFKFTERRGSFHKRYAYVCDWGSTSALGASNATVTSTLIDGVGDTFYVGMKTDYKSEGNIQGIFGQADLKVGSTGTEPGFYIPGQLIKVPFHDNTAADTADLAFANKDYIVGKIEEVIDSDNEQKILKLTIVRPISAVANNELAGWGAGAVAEQPLDGVAMTTAIFADLRIHDQIERARCYVVGTAHAEGSGYPETWKDQPLTTGYGQTQIWKTSMAMTNTARATSLKYDSSEWARVWKEKLIEHKWDIEQSLLFGSQQTYDGINYTQGAVDYILGYGNQFSWTTSKTQDDFLNDMSNYLDPRYNSGKATVFMVSTDVYNWLHQLGGYALQNLGIGEIENGGSFYKADLTVSGRKNILGLDTSVIRTVYGDINLVRNIHLDGTNVKILAINMNHVKYRPLVGNGVDRDTSIYVGVQTLENSGVDRRVDLILTEAGMEWQMPEAHAVWLQG